MNLLCKQYYDLSKFWNPSSSELLSISIAVANTCDKFSLVYRYLSLPIGAHVVGGQVSKKNIMWISNHENSFTIHN